MTTLRGDARHLHDLGPGPGRRPVPDDEVTSRSRSRSARSAATSRSPRTRRTQTRSERRRHRDIHARPSTRFGGHDVRCQRQPLARSVRCRPGSARRASAPQRVTPTERQRRDLTLTINTGTMAPGRHRFVDPRHRHERRLDAATRHSPPPDLGRRRHGSSAPTEYVDIVGFAVMRIATIELEHRSPATRSPRMIADPERSPIAPRSGGAVGALELAGAGTAHPTPRAAARPAPVRDLGGTRPWRWNTRTPRRAGATSSSSASSSPSWPAARRST